MASTGLAKAYETFGAEIDAMLDDLAAAYEEIIVPDDDVFRTAVRVYEQKAKQLAIDDVREKFQDALRSYNNR